MRIEVSDYLLKQACLYFPNRSPSDAVDHILSSYGDLLAEVRALRRSLSDIQNDQAQLDDLLGRLRVLCAELLDISA